MKGGLNVVLNLEGFKRIFDGQLSVIVPGNITEPQISEIVNNIDVLNNITIPTVGGNPCGSLSPLTYDATNDLSLIHI